MAGVAFKNALGVLGDVWAQKRAKLLDVFSRRRANISVKHSTCLGKQTVPNSNSSVLRSANESASRSIWCSLKQNVSRFGHASLESAERSASTPFRTPGFNGSRFAELVQRQRSSALVRTRAPYSRARLLLSMSPLVPIIGSLLAPEDVDKLEAAALDSLERTRLEDLASSSLCFDDLSLLRTELGICDARLQPARRIHLLRAAITRPLREWTFVPSATLGCGANRLATTTLLDAIQEVRTLHFRHNELCS